MSDDIFLHKSGLNFALSGLYVNATGNQVREHHPRWLFPEMRLSILPPSNVEKTSHLDPRQNLHFLNQE